MMNIYALLYSALLGIRRPDSWKKIKACDVILVGAECHFNFDLDGEWYSPLLGTMHYTLSSQGESVEVVLRPYVLKRTSSFSGNPVTYNRYHALTLATRMVGRLFPRFRKIAEHRDAAIWDKIIEKSKAKKIIAIMPSSVICRAARRAGIEIYDLQHGVINEQHPWYGEEFRRNTPVADLPTGYLVWDGDSASVIDCWARKLGVKVCVVGHPWLSRFMKSENGDPVIDYAFRNIPKFLNDLPCILVTLQWGMETLSSGSRHDGVFPCGLREVIAETVGKYNWMVRLHPVQIHGKESAKVLAYLKRNFHSLENVEWDKSSSSMLPALLSFSALHITFNSSVVIEAAVMGVKSAILDSEVKVGGRHDAYFRRERDIEMAEVVENDGRKLSDWIKKRVGE